MTEPQLVTVDMCRVCLKSKANLKKFVSILDTWLDKTFLDLLKDCTKINVAKHASLPSMLCQKCRRNLLQCWRFRELAEQTDKYLENYSYNSANEPIINEDQIIIVEDIKVEALEEVSKPMVETVKAEKFDSEDDLPLISMREVKQEKTKSTSRIRKDIKKEVADLKEDKKDQKSDKPKFYCCRCPQFYHEEQAVLDHYKVAHGKEDVKPKIKTTSRFTTDFDCKMCMTTCKTLKYLKLHQRQYQSVKQCQTCGLFVPRQKFSNHVATHLPDRKRTMHECNQCHKQLTGKKALKRHKETHINSYKYKCDECSKELKTESAWRSHLYYHELRRKGRNFKCPACPATFHRNNALEIHLRTHSGEKPFQCQYCDRKYADRSDLRRHVWQHTGQHPYRCKCGKVFTRKDYLKTHEKSCNVWPTLSSSNLPNILQTT